jgi:cellulose synthase/poly-beta-1,6-N-acetylglucosamine synthase-like glycosyltransferase
MQLIAVLSVVVLLLPDISVLLRIRASRLFRSHYSPDATLKKDVGKIDVIVSVKVPEDEYFALEWPLVYKERFGDSGNRLIVSSNGSWRTDFGELHPEACLLHTEGSGTKVMNLKKAVSVASCAVVAVFDVDARPHGAIGYESIAGRLIEADCIQGANIVSAQTHEGVSRFCEYESLISACVSETFAYGPGSTSQFRGTNAFFRRKVLEGLDFEVDTALEDIDATIRLLSGGRVIRFDPTFVAIEASPAGVSQLLKQRVRWMLGWGHLCRLHLWSVCRSQSIAQHHKFHVAGYLVWVTFLLPPAVVVVLTGDMGPVLVLFLILAKFFTLKSLILMCEESSRMSSVLEVCLHSRRATVSERIWFSTLLVFLDLLKSLALLGFLMGSGSSWSVTRKKRGN